MFEYLKTFLPFSSFRHLLFVNTTKIKFLARVFSIAKSLALTFALECEQAADFSSLESNSKRWVF